MPCLCVQFFTGFGAIRSTDETRGEAIQKSVWYNRVTFLFTSGAFWDKLTTHWWWLRLDIPLLCKLLWAQKGCTAQWHNVKWYSDFRYCSWVWHANSVFEYQLHVCAGGRIDWHLGQYLFLPLSRRWVKWHSLTTSQPSDPELKLYRCVTRNTWEKMNFKSDIDMAVVSDQKEAMCQMKLVQ